MALQHDTHTGLTSYQFQYFTVGAKEACHFTFLHWDRRRSEVRFEISELIIRRSLRILFHTVCLRISRLTRGRLERSVFNISPKQTLRGPLEFCPCKVSLVLCQITGFSLYLCQFQIKTRSPIDTSTESKLANAHRECDPSACTTTTSALIPHGLYFLYLLPWVSYSISPGFHFVSYVQRMRGTWLNHLLQVFTEQETDWREQIVNDLYFRPQEQHPWCRSLR